MFGFKSASKNDTEKPAGLFASLRQRLSKTRQNLSAGLADLLLGKKQIDAELLEQLEDQLLMADVGYAGDPGNYFAPGRIAAT